MTGNDVRDDNTSVGDNNDVNESSATDIDTSRAEPKQPEETITFEATAYTAYCEGCSGITYSGVDVRSTIYHEGRRIVAVDPAVIPLGSVVQVTLGNGESFEATALDIGSAIQGRKIDVLVSSKEEAYTFGRQSVEIRINN